MKTFEILKCEAPSSHAKEWSFLTLTPTHTCTEPRVYCSKFFKKKIELFQRLVYECEVIQCCIKTCE